ncbi:hypothetical protein DFP72DRAFT_882211 [Ephemerocybe angulata]|uniref:Nephrocystin 3-like N-terminal domain-containing protein n=1 Tax=Ephemerocybe angulata TaxID=980116 RepID=A0A8H6MCU5_9AGAR|nr:hypothetical protein DFP72DRAFT_882211 [Tulosesus angulatus]
MSIRDSSGFQIEDATFIQATNYNRSHCTIIQPTDFDNMKVLLELGAIAPEATHLSKTAAYAPKCKPGSRLEIIRDIQDWVTGACAMGNASGSDSQSILWFQGPAGAGKTCIMREVVDWSRNSQYLAASYFFSSRIPGLDKEDPFVMTVAHQLTTSIPPTEAHFLEGTSSYSAIRTLIHESLDSQLEKLIMAPMSSISLSRKMVVAVDGFDECRDPRERAHLLRLIRTLTTSIQRFVVIIASRPEFDIRTAFQTKPFVDITRFLRLQDYDGTSDIRDFFCDELCRIRETHPAKDSIPESWPTEATLNVLIDKSSGCYIYPATVIKHVDNPRRNPIVLLEEVISLSPTNASKNPLAELDLLYRIILHPPETDLALMMRILRCIMTATRGRYGNLRLEATPTHVDEFLCLSLGTTEMALCDLHSIVRMPTTARYGTITFHHRTVEDYLSSADRSQDLFERPSLTYLNLAACCEDHLRRWSEMPISYDTHVRSFSSQTWLVWLWKANPRLDTISQLLTKSSLALGWKHIIVHDGFVLPLQLPLQEVEFKENGMLLRRGRPSGDSCPHTSPTTCFRCPLEHFANSVGNAAATFARKHARRPWSTEGIFSMFAKFDEEVIGPSSSELLTAVTPTFRASGSGWSLPHFHSAQEPGTSLRVAFAGTGLRSGQESSSELEEPARGLQGITGSRSDRKRLRNNSEDLQDVTLPPIIDERRKKQRGDHIPGIEFMIKPQETSDSGRSTKSAVPWRPW